MDYEKLHQETLDKLQQFVAEGKITEKVAKGICADFVAKSEDERIRKEILEYFSQFENGELRGVDISSWIAWLEKQGKQKLKMKPKWLYRLEYKDSSCGLWYDGNGEWCFESGIGSLDDSCKTKSLPMDYDERYKQGGRDWFSSCTNKEDLLHWYSKEDAKILMSKGFVFTRYLATEYYEYEQQTVFIKETSLYREEIDFFSLFEKQKPVKWSEEDDRKLERLILYFEDEECFTAEDDVAYSIWLKCLKDRVLPQPKQEWIEEDTNLREATIGLLNLINPIDAKSWGKSRLDCIDWLKSLRPQKQWKPSEEEIKALEKVTYYSAFPDAKYCVDLKRLLEQLKAL